MNLPNRLTHLDADAFFASVEQASDPRLRGRPVAVGGEKRGIIASASYEARQFGIDTPMPTVRARRLCPRLVVLPGDFEKYERFSRWMFSYAYDFTPEVEVTSIDEGYFDLTAVPRDPVEVAQTIRKAIRDALKITVSEGLGSNKLVSQIASKLYKPAAFFEVPAGGEIPFLHPLPNHWLPGVGPKLSARLTAAGLVRIGQVASTPLEMLELLVGSGAPALRRFALGVDERPIVPAREAAKSYGQQETFAQDQTNEEFLEATLRRMADELFAKVRAEGKAVRTLTVKVRYNDMAEDQCSESLVEPTDLETEVYGRLRTMLRHAWKRRVSLRLVSLRLTNLYEGVFRTELAFDRVAESGDARRRLARVVDELREARGRYVVLRGHDFVLRDAAECRVARGPDPGTLAGGDNPALRSVDGARGWGRHLVVPGVPARVRPSTPVTYRVAQSRPSAIAYVPLLVRSHYSFLNSTLSPAAVVELARQQRCPAVALCDQGNLHGAAEFVQAAREAGVPSVIGAEVRVAGTPLWLYVENARGYANLCRILSGNAECRMQNEGGDGRAGVRPLQDLDGRATSPRAPRGTVGGVHVFGAPGGRALPSALGDTEGLVAVGSDPSWARHFPGRFYLGVASTEAVRRLDPEGRLAAVAISPIQYATPQDRWRFDVVQSIRTLTLLRQEHPDKIQGGAFHFPTAREFTGRFRDRPDLVERTRDVAERCAGFIFPFGPPQFPAFATPDGSAPREFLRRLVFAGAARRYPGSGQTKVAAQIQQELEIVHEVGYEEYFLVVWDILQECRRRGIDWITRGSAADSLICYCLGISNVCPIRFDLYFRRFLNKERMALRKLPDIDVDFPHDRKNDVVDLIFEKYGAEHCAVVGGFSTFQARSAFAEVGKVLGLAEREVRRFTEHFPWSGGGGWELEAGSWELGGGKGKSSSQVPHPPSEGRLLTLLRAIPECADLPVDEEPYRSALRMAEFLDGVPRYPKMHPCGVVLSRQPMHELTPTFRSGLGYPTTHFDMDAVEAIGLVKIDILAQGGLAVMRDVKRMLAARGVVVDTERCVAEKAEGGDSTGTVVSAGSLPPSAFPLFEDPSVWEMIAAGGARAVHHIESPAMTSLCRMSQVREIDGLIAVVSVIRPGAANERKKVKFTRRYQGLEPPEYPDPSLERCLRSTYGLVVYEEHILQICEAFAGLDGGRADVLRRALVKQKWPVVEAIAKEFLAAARARGHADAKIREVWELVTGFNGYAFCKAHSTAYGVEAYQSAWLKRYFPAEFMAAVLTNGKGFYAPLVYVLECHQLGIGLRPPWVNEPGPEYTVHAECGMQNEEGPPTDPSHSAFRILHSSFIQVPAARVKGLGERLLERIYQERSRGPFASLADFYRRTKPTPEEMEILIRVGAFDGFGQPRPAQFWEAQTLYRWLGQEASGQGWLFPISDANQKGTPAADSRLTEPSRRQRLQWEMELLGFTASGHPLELHDDVAWTTYCPVAKLGEHVGKEVVTCGLVIQDRVHHQENGEPMKFLTLCDRTGMVETELFAAAYRNYGLATVRYPVLELTARVEPFENGRGYTLRVLRAGKPRMEQRSTQQRVLQTSPPVGEIPTA